MKNPIRTLTVLTLGYAGGLLLAKKTGKTLRKEISKSENPAKTMLNAMKDADMEAFIDFKDWWSNSEKVQSLIKTGKDYFTDIAEEAKGFGEDAKEKTIKEFDRISKDAATASAKLKKEVVKKGKNMKKTIKKKTTKFKNELERKTKTIAKKIRK